ncbi:hypothetical protein Aduo_004441 [Ancylostoma duodenale]
MPCSKMKLTRRSFRIVLFCIVMCIDIPSTGSWIAITATFEQDQESAELQSVPRGHLRLTINKDDTDCIVLLETGANFDKYWVGAGLSGG